MLFLSKHCAKSFHLLLYAFIQQTSEPPLCTKHCYKHWGCKNEQNSQNPSFHATYILVSIDENKYICQLVMNTTKYNKAD